MHFSIHNDNLYIAYFLELREVLAIQIKKLENYEELWNSLLSSQDDASGPCS